MWQREYGMKGRQNGEEKMLEEGEYKGRCIKRKEFKREVSEEKERTTVEDRKRNRKRKREEAGDTR